MSVLYVERTPKIFLRVCQCCCASATRCALHKRRPTDEVQARLQNLCLRCAHAVVIMCNLESATKQRLEASEYSRMPDLYCRLLLLYLLTRHTLAMPRGAGTGCAENTMACVVTAQMIMPTASQSATAASMRCWRPTGLSASNINIA